MFTCNHCPFVKAYEDRLIQIQKDYSDKSVSLVAINSNETINYPEDTFEKMQIRVTEKSYNFPYLRDEDQSVASSYGASFTPEIFVFDIDRKLRYHGRIDDNKDPDNVTSSDLRNALDELLGRTVQEATGHYRIISPDAEMFDGDHMFTEILGSPASGSVGESYLIRGKFEIAEDYCVKTAGDWNPVTNECSN